MDDQRSFIASEVAETCPWAHNDRDPQLGPVRYSPGHQLLGCVCGGGVKQVIICGLIYCLLGVEILLVNDE